MTTKQIMGVLSALCMALILLLALPQQAAAQQVVTLTPGNPTAVITVPAGVRVPITVSGGTATVQSDASLGDPTLFSMATGDTVVADDEVKMNWRFNFASGQTLYAGYFSKSASGSYTVTATFGAATTPATTSTSATTTSATSTSTTPTTTQGQAVSVPSAPQNISARSGNSQITLSWTAPASGGSITSYQVSSDGGSTWVTASSNTSHTFTGLTNGTRYSFRVRAVNSAGTGATVSAGATPQAPTATAPVSITVPTAPQNLTAVPSSGQTVITWRAPSTNGGSVITRYEVFCSRDNAWVTASSNTSHTFTGLNAGTTYVFRVRAVNSVGTGAHTQTTARN
ncbi:MAG: fibronectin type III domain-containing protein [Treponema sp.]|nr:fibronectin type III domain-containing protein [Treponema sp.]